MAKQSIQLQSPIKGVNRVFARGQQPDGTCYDALNMLPFDRYGRLRASQRQGTSKLYAVALGGGTNSVSSLTSTTLIVPVGLSFLGVAFVDPLIGPWLANIGEFLPMNLVPVTGDLRTLSDERWITSSQSAGAGVFHNGFRALTQSRRFYVYDTTNTGVFGCVRYAWSMESTLLNEPFTYANGALNTRNANWRASSESTAWKSGVTAAADNTKVMVAGSDIEGSTADRSCAAIYTAAISLGSDYMIQANATPMVADTSDAGCKLICRVNTVTFDDNHISLAFNGDHMKLCLGDGTILASHTFSPALATSMSTIYLRVEGNTITGLVNGTEYVRATSAVGAGNTGVGFATRAAAANLTATEIDAFIVYPPDTKQHATTYVPLIPLALPANYAVVLTTSSNIAFPDTADEGYRVHIGIGGGDYLPAWGGQNPAIGDEGCVSLVATATKWWVYQDTVGLGGAVTQIATGNWVPAAVPHVLRIERTAAGVTNFLLDGTQVHTEAALTLTHSNVGWGIGRSAVSITQYATNFQVLAGVTAIVPRKTVITYTVGDSVYMGTNIEVPALATGGGGILTVGSVPQVAYIFEHAYIVDGATIQKLDVRTGLIEAYTASAGALPIKPGLIAAWRGRLVFAAIYGDEQNFYCSKLGYPADFDYAAVGADAAFAGNASTAGRIGDVITALIPASDDLLFFGGDHTLWVMRGDPRAGGSIDAVSSAIGVVGAQAWCKDPQETLYFVGTGGLYKIAAGTTAPIMVSTDKYTQFFTSIARNTHIVTMAWDRDKFGCYVFVTPIATGAATHLWYDARTDGLWPIQLPNAMGPISCLVYDGDGPTDRVLLLGGRAGLVQKLDSTVRTDDGTAISSYLVLGPFHPNAGDSVLTGGVLDFGEVFTGGAATEFNATATFRAGITAYNVTEGTPDRVAAITFSRDRRGKRFQQRIRGEWFTVKVANAVLNKYFSFEDGQLDFESAGLNRGQR